MEGGITEAAIKHWVQNELRGISDGVKAEILAVRPQSYTGRAFVEKDAFQSSPPPVTGSVVGAGASSSPSPYVRK